MEGPEVGEGPVSASNGLRLLKVGVSRKEDFDTVMGQLQQGSHDSGELFFEGTAHLHSPEAEVCGDLIVPGSARVEFARQRTDLLRQKALYEGMDILVRSP
jgi:hypothetical protein